MATARSIGPALMSPARPNVATAQRAMSPICRQVHISWPGGLLAVWPHPTNMAARTGVKAGAISVMVYTINPLLGGGGRSVGRGVGWGGLREGWGMTSV